MLFTIGIFALLWLTDFYKTKADRRGRIVFVLLYLVCLTFALTVSSGARVPSAAALLQKLLTDLNLTY